MPEDVNTKKKIPTATTAGASKLLKVKNFVKTRSFSYIFATVALATLIGTTIFWSILGARLQSGNADQLVNSYLFNSPATFHNAFFPGNHSFLIKWPIFMLIKIFGYSPASFTFFTLALTLISVLFLAFILWRIERRPLVFGVLCLALASALLLVPAEPAVGNLLPVNMAMIATRNLEYVLYISALWLLVRPSFKSPKFWVAVILLGALIASDKLFLSLSIGGALLALVAYALSSGWNMVKISVKWLMAGIFAAPAAMGGLYFLSHHLTHITTQNGLGPYGLVHSAHDAYLSLIYAAIGFFTNFGANPAFDTTVLKSIPHQAHVHILSLSGPALLINIAVVIIGLYSSVRLLITSFAHNNNHEVELNDSSRLGIMLIWSMIASVVIFVTTAHYYAGDARYLTIGLFSLFVALAVLASRRTWRPEVLTIAGIIVIISIALAVPTVLRSYRAERQALAPSNQRNALVAAALARHPVKVLVGDYWRVIPTKYISKKSINVMPLSDCKQSRNVLTSQAWQVNLNNNSFAYLLTLDHSLTDYPNCTLKQVINNYGRPNASVVIAGNYSKPKEILLFYDRGAHKNSPNLGLKNPSTVVPVGLDELPYTTCKGPTIMNIVAHQDDDLLFMNPDLASSIKAGYCVRTVYITAGDAGSSGQFYWLSREQGSQAAYSQMIGISEIWVERIVKLANNQYISVANPRGNSKISLIYMRLPDGNVNGQGFPATHFESLAKLEGGSVASIEAVYSGSTYGASQLRTAISNIMHTYQPTEIRTQANYTTGLSTDHSDHMAVNRYVTQAYSQYEKDQYDNKLVIPIKYYQGYTIHDFPENVAGDVLAEKESIFFAYAKFDGGVCHSDYECVHRTVYGGYLRRQYLAP